VHQFPLRFAAEEAAVTSIEYALLASLIAIVIIGGIALVGEGVANLYNLVSTCVAAAAAGSACSP
jgi:pilus assembly protein Flp/PilA